jgi:hypothetical protein
MWLRRRGEEWLESVGERTPIMRTHSTTTEINRKRERVER